MERAEKTATAPRTLVAYVVAVNVAALAALTALPAASLDGQVLTVLLLAGLAALLGSRSIGLPGLKSEINATHPFIFFALAALGVGAAAVVALTGVIAAALGRERRPTPIHLVFNLGAVLLSTVAASGAFRALGGHPDQDLVSLMPPLAGATVAFFFVNTGLVAAAISLDKHQPLFSTWRGYFLWTSVSYATGLSLAFAMLAVLDAMVPWGLVLGLPPCWLLVMFYRQRAANLRVQQAG